MGEIQSIEPVKFFCGLLYTQEFLLDSIVTKLSKTFGELEDPSESWPFNTTTYYQKEMGTKILRCFIFFKELRMPDELVALKKKTNKLEKEFVVQKVERPTNRSYYVNVPVVLAEAIDLQKGDQWEWLVEDKNTLILSRIKTKPKRRFSHKR